MFLDLFGFAYVQFRKSVHKNDSKTLDKLWRDNLTTARTSKANKTNYSKMSVVLVYWGCALREPLQSVFHATRTLRWINTHVGWDFPILPPFLLLLVEYNFRFPFRVLDFAKNVLVQ